jgi:Fe2+ or Zn2+ uptake regulation protein
MIGIIPNKGSTKKILLERDLKPTYQRIMILEYLANKDNHHMTAEEIHEALHKKTPMLSLTTVYNTLNSFCKAGLVSAITITGTEVRYEIATKPHHHLLCKHCGRIIDIDIQCPISKRKHIKGYRVDEVHGYFKGVCKQCLKESHKRKAALGVKTKRRKTT